MKLLIVNPNTTVAVTERVVVAARDAAGPDVRLTSVTGTMGAAIVTNAAEEAVAAHVALDLLATHHGGHDAAILAISFDSGLVAARGILPIPVVGLTQSALHMACLLGRRIGLISFGMSSRGLYLDLIARYGLTAHVAALDTVELTSTAAYLDGAALDAAVSDLARRQVERHAVEVVVLAGAAIVGMAARLQATLPVPVLDGIGPAVMQAMALARLGLRSAPAAPPLSVAPPSGLAPELTRLLSAAGRQSPAIEGEDR